ncbi:MAG TPA: GntR family transcriptional regulator [Anaerolineales bacterium]|nr:GntR family transcriptional regulator [Anaerolineales bacterium]
MTPALRSNDIDVLDAPYPSLDRTDLAEQTYQVLKDRILRRQLHPGERISVDDIARRLHVSRTPVTDALKRLAVEGLVEIIPRRGTFVSSLTARDVGELFDVRAVIELYAARRIVCEDKTEEFLRRVAQPMERMRRATASGDYRDYSAFMDGDRDFHQAMVDLTGNTRLAAVYAELNVHIQVSRAHYLSTVEEAVQALREHDAIIAAFRTHDPSAVQESLEAHITNVKSRILDLLGPRGGQL